MATRHSLLEQTLAGRLVAIIRLHEDADLLHVAEALAEGGVLALEFTLTTPGALAAIQAARTRFGAGVVVGAGTVLDADSARRCLDAGAQFLVSPGFDPAVVEVAHSQHALAMPGALTPTEILTAWRAGADVIKIFPARQFGPRYIADIRAPLPDVPLMPTGGVDATNAAAFLEAGAVGVAVGGSLVDPTAVARHEWHAIATRAALLVSAVRAAQF